MTEPRKADFSLRDAIRDAGFTPRVRDAGALLELLAEPDEDLVRDASRALLRVGAPAAKALVAQAASPDATLRARIAKVAGRLDAKEPNEALFSLLRRLLSDAEPGPRRAAARALGKLTREGVEAPLLEALASETSSAVQRTLVEALGKVGSSAAAAALSAFSSREAATPAVEEASDVARLRLERTVTRGAAPSSFAEGRVPDAPLAIVLRCRAGLEDVLRSELPRGVTEIGGGRARRPGTLDATLRDAPSCLFQARTMLSFAFPLPARPNLSGDVADAIADSLCSNESMALLTSFTTGPIRYRVAWASGGKRRGAVHRLARSVTKRCPALMNDPRENTWEVLVHESPGEIRLDLTPRFVDPRFTYRHGDVPAASHPTIAAALVRVAGAKRDDVVWDPFVGSASELCERARAGPYRALIGTDRDPRALAVARRNLSAAGADDATLVAADALTFVPDRPPTLILTNPPMGRRVARGDDLGALLDRFLARAARLLAPGGRIVWMAPMPERSALSAEAAGLWVEQRTPVDMGGFSAELQRLSRKGR